ALPTPRPASAFPAPARSTRAWRVLNRLRLAPEEKRDAALRIEFHHHRRHLVDDPDVVLRIDANLRGKEKPVVSLADFAREFSAAIELKQPRSAVHEDARRSHRHRRMTGACIDEDV